MINILTVGHFLARAVVNGLVGYALYECYVEDVNIFAIMLMAFLHFRAEVSAFMTFQVMESFEAFERRANRK